VKRITALAGAAALTLLGGASPSWAAGNTSTSTPIKHLVVIFDENISFDHYFGTYPDATNEDGTKFTPAKDTPKTDNLVSAGLLDKNPNLYAPKRLSPEHAMTCDQNHNYGAEQYAYNGGKADKFVENTETSKCTGGLFGEPGLVMDYYDGNTVTGLWNYAQQYSLNDHSFSSVYGPSTPGALNLVSGQTHGVISTDPASGSENPKQTSTPDAYTVVSPDAKGVGTVTNDPDPAYDDCSVKDHTSKSPTGAMKGKNIGDLLNAKGVSWGWFQGGFRPGTAWDGQQGHYAKCGGTTHANVGGARVVDYNPHHAPFQYYKSTANPHHLPPASVDEIGHAGQANHNYDLTDFDAALKTAHLPSVSYLKAPEYQDGHAGYSDPIDEQHFLTSTINKIQKSPQWRSTAVVIAYDDSDGWYDHVTAKVANGSKDNTVASNGKPNDAPACQDGPKARGGYKDRCGPGARQPLLVISPYAKHNFVDSAFTDQTSVVKFIEDNWHLGRIGDASFDAPAKPLDGLFDYRNPHFDRVLLKSDGSVDSVSGIPHDVPVASTARVNAASYARHSVAMGTSGLTAGETALAATSGAVLLGGAGVAVLLHRRRTTA
jgi:phospholipase C